MFKNFIIPLTLLFFGVFFTSFYKNKSKNLEEKIANKKDIIYELKKSNELELKENIFLKSPENIKKLANEYLDKDYIFFEKKNIEYLEINEKK
ncbi:MAG: hypothetical protein MRY23_02715 [Pelagibacteraceae bacterium]|nr:hypothetical protein [Pelagibacteraceae bacterium]MCI5079503.1 hypothetical protein [Pelagibacteraceae bacterium]